MSTKKSSTQTDHTYFKHGSYDSDILKYEPSRIIVDNEAIISMTKYKKDTTCNIHIARRYHYIRQGTTLNIYVFV